MKLDTPDHAELRSKLAAEYVLGTMHGAARRRFVVLVRENDELANEVRRWQAHLTPLASHIVAVEPPARVWKNISARISPSADKSNSWWDSLAFWRNLSLGASTLSAVLLVAMLAFPPADQEPMMTAVLAHDGVARMVVEQPKNGMLMVKVVNPWKDVQNHSMELWVIGKDGKPQSLGVIHDSGDTKIAMAKLDLMLNGGTTFALSLEPVGGSPTGLPTGSVLCSGAIARMPNATKPSPI